MQKLEERIRQYEPFFGEWTLGKEIESLGSGSFGKVFTIRKGPLVAALKVISIPPDESYLNKCRMQGLSDEEIRKHIIRDYQYARKEIEIMKDLNGTSNVVYFEQSRIYERTDTFGWDVLIRMEKLVRLDEYLRINSNKNNTKLILHIWDDLLEGLKACQKQGIVHLDIKPDNIFYSPATDYFKLGDFGEAQKQHNGEPVIVGGQAGTREYMSPEIYHGRGGDARSDIYSLALTIYKLLNNDRLPFTESREDLIRANEIRWNNLKDIPKIKGLDNNVMLLLQRCLEYSPDRRFYNAVETQDILRRIVYSGGSLEGKSKNLGLIIAFVLIGFAGILVFLGIISSGSKKDQPQLTQASGIETTFVPDGQYYAEETPLPTIPQQSEAPTQVPTEIPTVVPTDTPTVPPTETPTIAPTDTPTVAPTEIPTVAPTDTPAPTPLPVAEIRSFSLLVNGEEIQDGEAILDGDSCRIHWSADGETEGFFVYLYDERGNLLNKNENTDNVGLEIATAGIAHDERYRLVVGAMPRYGSEADILWRELVLIHPEPTPEPTAAPTATPEPTPEPTAAPTATPAPTPEPTAAPTATPTATPEPTIAPLMVEQNIATQTGYINGEGVEYRGSAEPGESVNIYLNGVKVVRTEADENGEWTAFLKEEHFNDREHYFEECEYEVSFAYKDGKVKDKHRVIFDAGIEMLEIDGVLRLDDRYVRGITEPGAEVAVLRKNTQLGRLTRADEDGRFEVDLGATFEEHGQIVNNTITVMVVDKAGNTISWNYTLQYKEVLPLQIEIPAASANGNVPVSDEFVMILTGEPMEECEIKLVSERNGYHNQSEQTVVLNENGMFTEIAELYPGKYEISVRYLNTYEGNTKAEFVVDGDSRLISLDGEFVAGERTDGNPTASPEIPAGAHSLSGRTRPNARVYISGNGVYAEVWAENGGQFVLPEVMLEKDKEYIITAENANGARLGSMSIYAIEVEYAPLTVNIPMMIDKVALIDSGVLRMKMNGQPNAAVIAILFNDNSAPLFESVILDEEGDGRLWMKLTDGDYKLQLCYTDREDSLQNYEFTIDRSAEFVEIEGEILEGTKALSGRALSGASVTLEYTEINDVRYDAVYTGDGSAVSAIVGLDGSFVLPETEYSSAYKYQLSVYQDGKRLGATALEIKALQPIVLVSLEDPAVLNANTANLTLGISAMENSDIDIYINDALVDTVTADASGNSWYVVNREQLQSEQVTAIYAEYTSGGGRSDVISAYYDPGCILEIPMVFENSRELYVHTDPGAHVEIQAEGYTLLTGNADAGGNFGGSLDKPLSPGTEIRFTASDDYGNISSETTLVKMLDRVGITAQIAPEGKNGVLNDLSQLKIIGEAEAGTLLHGSIYLDGALVVDQSFTSDANGRYEWADFNIVPSEDAKNMRVGVRYGDGYASEILAEAAVNVDLAGPKIQLDYDVIDADADRIAGTASENAVIHLYSEMARIDETMEVSAGERFAFEYLVLSEGDQLTLSATDAYGNATIRELIVSAPIRSSAGFIKIDKDSYASGDAVKLEGWVLCREEDEGIIGLQLAVENGTLGQVALTGKTEMTDAEFQQKISEISEPIKANKGFWISQNIKLGENAAAGSVFWPGIVIQHQYEDWVYIHNTESRAQVESTSGTAAAIHNFINDTSAMGFDLGQSASFPANKVMLTGWFYGRDYSIHKIVFWPVSNPGDRTTLWIDSTDLASVSTGESLVCYLPRKAAEACPQEYRQKLSEVVPDDNIAGFILNLDLQKNEDGKKIENGEYVIAIHAATDGPVEETANIRIIIDDTASVDTELAEKISQEWNPVVPEDPYSLEINS